MKQVKNYYKPEIAKLINSVAELTESEKKLILEIVPLAERGEPLYFTDEYYAGRLNSDAEQVALDILRLAASDYIVIQFPGSDENWKREITLSPNFIAVIEHL
jgi:hypothetical protein